jgi:glycosyltransferase involved in cell wall biosynthesis
VRILHLFASPYWTGPAENIAHLALAQRALGHDVHVAIDTRRSKTTSEEPGRPRFEALNLLDDGGLDLSVKSPPWRMWRDACLLAARQVDVVHTHFSHDHLLARLKPPKGARVVRSIHAPRSIRWSLPEAFAYTVPSLADMRRLVGRRVAVLPPLIGPEFKPAPDRSKLRRELGLSDQYSVGMISTFQPSRHHDVGVEAFRIFHDCLPEARFVLVGDGQELERTRARVQQAGLEEATTFAGYQSGEAFVRWLQALDLVWILGLGNDWSGRAAAQARACDVRVLAVDEGALAGLADAVVPLDPAAIASESLTVARAERTQATNEQIARDILRLYNAA